MRSVVPPHWRSASQQLRSKTLPRERRDFIAEHTPHSAERTRRGRSGQARVIQPPELRRMAGKIHWYTKILTLLSAISRFHLEFLADVFTVGSE